MLVQPMLLTGASLPIHGGWLLPMFGLVLWSIFIRCDGTLLLVVKKLIIQIYIAKIK